MKKSVVFLIFILICTMCLSGFAAEVPLETNIEFYCAPQVMREDSGEIDVWLNVRNMSTLPDTLDTLCGFSMTVAWDPEQFFLKTEGGIIHTGAGMLVKEARDITAVQRENTLSLNFLDESLGDSLIERDGVLCYFTLAAVNPKQLWNSLDSYPLRFVPGSLSVVTYHRPSFTVGTYDRIAGIDVGVSGYNVAPALQVPSLKQFLTFTEGETRMYAGENAVEMDVAPFKEGDTYMIPIRFLLENAGMTVAWDGETNTANAYGQYQTLQINLAESRFYYNAKLCKVLPPPEERDGRIFVPADVIKLLFGQQASVLDNGEGSVKIYIP